MAGYLVQHYAEQHPEKLAGLVIMSGLPPRGAWGGTGRLLIHHPRSLLRINTQLNAREFVSTPELCQAHLFHDGIPLEEITDYCAGLDNESWLIFINMLTHQPRIRKIRGQFPVMVMSGELDGTFLPKEVARTARAYGVDHILFEGMSHTLMFEPGWEEVADSLNTFVAGL